MIVAVLQTLEDKVNLGIKKFVTNFETILIYEIISKCLILKI